MAWSAPEVEEIIERMRAGASVMDGGSRCHTTWFFRDGRWWYEGFDEGHTEEHETSEAAIRSLIASDPARFSGVLRAPRWAAFSAAFLAGRPDARALLHAALHYGDSLEHGKILDAVLAGPDEPPSEAVLALIRRELRGFTAYHCFMDAAQWDRGVEVGARGVAFADRLRALVGDAPGVFGLRAQFHEQAGDLAAARADLVRELEQTEEDWRREQYQRQLDRLRSL